MMDALPSSFIKNSNYEFLKIHINRDDGIKIIEKQGFTENDVLQALVQFLPNGEAPIGSIKLSVENQYFYCAIILSIDGQKGGYLYKIPIGSIEGIVVFLERIFQINIAGLPSWKYNIEYIAGLRFLLYNIMTKRKVVIIGDKVEIALFILSSYKIFKVFSWTKLDGIIYSDSLSGIEEIHGIESPEKYRWELQTYSSELCIVDLTAGQCFGGRESSLLRSIEKYFRLNQEENARSLMEKIVKYLSGEPVDLKKKKDDEILFQEITSLMSLEKQ